MALLVLLVLVLLVLVLLMLVLSGPARQVLWDVQTKAPDMVFPESESEAWS